MQATCNVGYDPEKREASGSAIDVGTFYGESIAVADIELHQNWESYGAPFLVDIPQKIYW